MKILTTLSGILLAAAGAFCFAFNTMLFTELAWPVGIAMSLEGAGVVEKKLSDVAKDVINQSYDVFGRDKIEIVD